ncbi:MAG TPA: LacI family DNA-binding transcriptional regulator [Blastocatellia bacterium]|nr:LacI family DNA-binding transcriptional regulator [Blastocatellia bacterium]
MPRRNGNRKNNEAKAAPASRPVSLKELAAHLGLSPTTLSLVLNDSPLARSIPAGTQQRIFEAAREFNYRPHFLARSLRAQRSFTLGVLVPELSDGYSAMVVNGIEEYLLREGYFYFVASHRHRRDLLDRYPKMLLERCVEGLIAVDTPYRQHLGIPVAAVSGHEDVPEVTNIVLNHKRAATLALEYLRQHGHERLAVIKGQDFSSDTRVRWEAIRMTAKRLGVLIHPKLAVPLEGDSPSPETGYVATQQLLATGEPFTALFAFNDISAIGAIRALREAGLNVPEDVSVVGFDDVDSASFHNPALTTVRQPLREMGRLAAETVLQRIANGPAAPYPELLMVEPELIIRQSTAKARGAGAPTRRMRR